jgi:hypothetical protein
MIRMRCGSDGGCEAVKGDPEPVAGRDVGRDLVVAAAQVLDEGMTGARIRADRCRSSPPIGLNRAFSRP